MNNEYPYLLQIYRNGDLYEKHNYRDLGSIESDIYESGALLFMTRNDFLFTVTDERTGEDCTGKVRII